MYSVYQHWDPLKVCVVGRSYPPEFYSWIKVPHVRELFEKIAIETEEDYQGIIKTLQKFGVEILRPEIGIDNILDSNGQYRPPPMTPRDTMVMIGSTFYSQVGSRWEEFYSAVKDPSWDDYESYQDFLKNAPDWQIKELKSVHESDRILLQPFDSRFNNVLDHVKKQGNIVKLAENRIINGAMVSRIGRDLYFATEEYNADIKKQKQILDLEFINTRNHVVNTGGHGDGTYCPVCPGLIVSLRDVPTYAETFPGWEVVYLPGQSWNTVKPFLDLKNKNRGKWWIPGFEHDQSVIDTVETWLGHWTGYVEETVFDVNMLIIDPKNVMVFNYNKQVFDAFERYGITPHIVPFRHRYFWDGGIHCVTLDLHREGVMRDYFPERG